MATFEQAIVKTGGKQYRVVPGTLLRVEKLDGAVGEEVQFGEVLLLGRGSDAKVGTPLVPGAKVTGTITAQGRGPKLIVYKFKRRKNYRRKQGHRQAFTEVKVEDITG
jgi:large subunit ribosomal protein L21